MPEIDWVKLLVIGTMTAMVMAPQYWGAVERWFHQLCRSWS
jgi:hypothetical protein